MTISVQTNITPQQAISSKENLNDYSGGDMIDGFKKFIARGQMIDMAVGVVMGAAVTAVVNAIVKSFITPLIAMIFGKPNLAGILSFTVNGATVSFGAIIDAVLNFLIIGVSVYFFIVMPINKFRDLAKRRSRNGEEDETEPELSAEDQTVALLTEIRDSLAAQGATTAAGKLTVTGSSQPSRSVSQAD